MVKFAVTKGIKMPGKMNPGCCIDSVKGKSGSPCTSSEDMPGFVYLSDASDFDTPPLKKRKSASMMVDAKPVIRKLRKSCSLDTCNQTPGECMHCTCDGRCGQHLSGKCGTRREGSGKNCKREMCPRDDTCLHSTRATCCHCRNLVSSLSRGKLKRLSGGAPPKPKIHKEPNIQKMLVPAMKPWTVSIDPPEIETSDLGFKSLSEYPSWSKRQHLCNLIAVIDGVQFNLHKFPMLMVSPELKNRVGHSSVPVVKLDNFPGGVEAFELACIYSYNPSLEVHDPQQAVSLFCAARFLGISRGSLIQKTAKCLQRALTAGDALNVVKILHRLHHIESVVRVGVHLTRFNLTTLPWLEKFRNLCYSRVARQHPFDLVLTQALQKLPCDQFLRVSQLVLATGQGGMSTNVVAQLCGQAHLAQVFQADCSAVEKAINLKRVLDGMMRMGDYAKGPSELVLKVACEVGLEAVENKSKKGERELAEKGPEAGRILAQALTRSLVVN